MSISDLQLLTIEQVDALLELEQWIADANEYAKEDKRAAAGEAAFFA